MDFLYFLMENGPFQGFLLVTSAAEYSDLFLNTNNSVGFGALFPLLGILEWVEIESISLTSPPRQIVDDFYD